MDLKDARAIVRTLAEGADPITGEAFPRDSPYNNPRVIRALFTVHEHAKTARTPLGDDDKRRRNLEAGRPRNSGLRWTDEDRARVAAEYRNGRTMEELAAALERSRLAVHTELANQGLVSPPDV